MPVYRTTFAVDAPAARVWQALTALERYPEWNPQIPRICGSLRPGSGSTYASRFPTERR
jgi:uncharacterized protein YndB with AHSA1/START domain